jgi:hypothetical protein
MFVAPAVSVLLVFNQILMPIAEAVSKVAVGKFDKPYSSLLDSLAQFQRFWLTEN